MTPAVDSYLAMRHAAGFHLVNSEYLLRSFARCAAERGETHVRTATAIEWACRSPSVAQRDTRFKTVCRFARYMHTEDDRHDVPPRDHFGYRKTRRVPYIYSNGEINRLMHAAGQLGPPASLPSQMYPTLIGLLAATGLRISEALALQVSDVTPNGLLIRHAKFQKTRLVPLHSTTVASLQRYLTRRREERARGTHVFIADDGRPLPYWDVHRTFRKLVKTAGLAPASDRRPCLHALRHNAESRIMPSWSGVSKFPLPERPERRLIYSA